MALGAGRKGLASELVDEFGYLTGEMPTGEYYTKSQTDNKFETKTHVNNNFQKKTLELPLETLMGSKLTVEDSLDALNEIQKTRQPITLELPLETLVGSKLTVPDSLDALNEIQKTRQPKTLEVPLEMLSGSKLTVESALQGLNEEKFDRAEQRVLGAKNQFNYKNLTATSDTSLTISNVGREINIKTSSNGKYKAGRVLTNIEPNTDYIISCSVVITSGKSAISVSTVGGTEIAKSERITTSGELELRFNSGNNSQLRIFLYCTWDTSEEGDVTYNDVMFRLASDPDDTYVSYAMTNREITEELTVEESACTDIITGATVDTNKIRKVGKIVFLDLVLSAVTTSSFTSIAKIPSGFVPKSGFWSNGINRTDVSASPITITSLGDVQSAKSLSNNQLSIHESWVTS